MPKASFNPADHTTSSFQWGEGWGEVMDAISCVNQFTNKDGDLVGDPAPMVKLLVQKTTDQGEHIPGEPVEIMYGCGKLAKFTPGVAENADDEDPQDMGEHQDAEGNWPEGNCLYAHDGATIDTRSKWSMLLGSMAHAEFDPTILSKGFLPDLVGTKGFFYTKKLEKEAGREYKRDPEVVLVKSITHMPYGKVAAKKGAGTAAKPAAAPKPAQAAAKPPAAAAKPAPAAAKAAAVAPAAAGDDGTLALKVLAAIKGQIDGMVTTKALIGKAIMAMSKGVSGELDPVNPTTQKAVQALLKDAAWCEANQEGGEYTYSDDSWVFA